MNRNELLERERAGRSLAGWTAVAAGPLFIIATFLSQNIAVPFGGLETERLRAIDDAAGGLLVSAVLQALAVLSVIPILLYLFRAAQARSERVRPAMVGFVFIGPILLAIFFVAFSIAQSSLASDFVSQAGPGGDIYTLLDDLRDDNTLYQFAASLYLPATIGFVVGVFYVALQAMRTGLLTRMSATLGMALAVATIVIAGPAMIGVMIWFGWVGFTVLGKTPRGAPPAWAAGEAMPWPKAGEQAARPAAAAEAPVEGDATEVFAEAEPQDHSARRERARKKKRKRRG